MTDDNCEDALHCATCGDICDAYMLIEGYLTVLCTQCHWSLTAATDYVPYVQALSQLTYLRDASGRRVDSGEASEDDPFADKEDG